MRFGDFIKQAREEKSWSQPEAALKAKIEQSYLSKLETGKSYPSEEVFDRLVSAYDLDIDDLSRHISSTELEKLREIKQLRASILGREKKARAFSMQWMLAGLMFLVIGGASLGIYYIAPGTHQMVYHYRSDGVIRPGESLDIFRIVHHRLTPQRDGKDELAQQVKMLERLDQVDFKTQKTRGSKFVENVEGGKRVYEIYESNVEEITQPLRWFLVPALGFLFGALGCFFISYRRGN